MHRYVSRYESGVDPNNRARLLQLYYHYKGFSETINNPAYTFTNDVHHTYMVENYVEKIASAVRTIDGNRFPLSYYMWYGWVGLEDAGYTSSRLTTAELNNLRNLKAQVESGYVEPCNY